MLKIALPMSKSKTQHFINQTYVNYIKASGYEPILLTEANDVVEAARSLDGLILPGGIDIDPMYYGEDNLASYSSEPEKDDFERELFHAFIAQSKPIFGICRGFQLIAREFVRLGLNKGFDNQMDYIQHINKHNGPSDFNVSRTIPTHFAEFAYTDILYDKPKEDGYLRINSIHHQAFLVYYSKKTEVLSPIGLLRPLAVTKHGIPSKGKGFVCEAFEIRGWNNTPVRAVQWHPEELNDTALLKCFFDKHSSKKIKPAPAEVSIASTNG